MRTVEESGRSVEEAVAQALRKLAASESEVNIEILEEGSRGLLGILGGRPARVRVTLKDSPAEKARQFLESVVASLGIEATVSAVAGDDGIQVNVEGEDVGPLIGRRGHSLDAWQYLTALVANKGSHESVRVFLDVAGYRERRAATLERLARRTAARVKARRRSVALEPMPAAERRVIHLALQDDPDVVTGSEGREPYRRVVVSPRGRESSIKDAKEEKE
ncbi:MAG: protein jag [Firmicutes bacterium]|nr:protein jag [Bacillota bacterium]